MDLRQLRYFTQVAEVDGFNEAAAKLNVSQSSVSRRVRDLELELRTQLFERSSTGARLTESGRMLLDRALRIIREIEVAKADVMKGSTEPTGKVTVGFSSASAQLFIAPLVDRVASRFPFVKLNFLEGTQYMLFEMVETHKVDFAVMISPGPISSCTIQGLTVEDLFYVRRAGKPPLQREVHIDALHKVPLVLFPRPSPNRDFLDQAAAIAGINLDVHFEVVDLGVHKQLISAGHVDGILPMSAVQGEVNNGELVASRLRGLFMSRALVWHANRGLLPSVKAVADCVRGIASEVSTQSSVAAPAPGSELEAYGSAAETAERQSFEQNEPREKMP